MEPISIIVRAIGLFIWLLVIVQTVVVRHEPIIANRPRRDAMIFVVAMYALATVVGSVAGDNGLIALESARGFYTVVSAIACVLGVVLLTAPKADR